MKENPYESPETSAANPRGSAPTFQWRRVACLLLYSVAPAGGLVVVGAEVVDFALMGNAARRERIENLDAKTFMGIAFGIVIFMIVASALAWLAKRIGPPRHAP